MAGQPEDRGDDPPVPGDERHPDGAPERDAPEPDRGGGADLVAVQEGGEGGLPFRDGLGGQSPVVTGDERTDVAAVCHQSLQAGGKPLVVGGPWSVAVSWCVDGSN